MTDVAEDEKIARLDHDKRIAGLYLVDWFTIVVLAVFVFSLLGRYFFYAELLGNFRCQILLVCLMPIAVLALVMRRWIALGALVVAICWSTMGVATVYGPASQPPPGQESLRVMSFNVLVGNSEYEKVIGVIKESDPDVVSIIEYADHWHRELDRLNQQYPHQFRHPRWHGFGIAIFSKHPLSETVVHQLTKKRTDNPFLVAKVTKGKQTIRLAVLHVLSPTNEIRLKLRNQQIQEVAQLLSSQDEPTVVMGDFNCTPWSPFLSDFLKTTGYRDSRQGNGYQASWHSRYWPLRIPIDHAFVSNDVHVHDRYVGGYAGSDHFPIVFEISTAE